MAAIVVVIVIATATAIEAHLAGDGGNHILLGVKHRCRAFEDFS